MQGVQGLNREDYQNLFNGEIKRFRDMLPEDSEATREVAQKAYDRVNQLETAIRVLKARQHGAYVAAESMLEHLSEREREAIRKADAAYKVRSEDPEKPRKTRQQKAVDSVKNLGVSDEGLVALFAGLAKQQEENRRAKYAKEKATEKE